MSDWTNTEIPNYRPPFLFRNGHLVTVGTHLLKRTTIGYSDLLRIETPDEDEFYTDLYRGSGNKVVVLLHGLEGSSRRPYIMGFGKIAAGEGWDVAAMNFRSCNGIMNKSARFYHSGFTGDLDLLINHLIVQMNYETVALAGFSMGGNVVLKYLGEKRDDVNPAIKMAMAVSVPVDLGGSSRAIEHFQNRIYLSRFLRSLKDKVRKKMELFPDELDWEKGLWARNFYEFDDAITAPLYEFENAEDYYNQSSSIHYLSSIRVPTMLLSARDDSFLSKASYPRDINNKFLKTLYPKYGGHVGFSYLPVNRETYAETVFQSLLQSPFIH